MVRHFFSSKKKLHVPVGIGRENRLVYLIWRVEERI
jgi:hypothetical protein